MRWTEVEDALLVIAPLDTDRPWPEPNPHADPDAAAKAEPVLVEVQLVDTRQRGWGKADQAVV